MFGNVTEERGFALIELLVVVVLIGVLAVIAVPSFLSQREKGQDACAKSQLHTMQTALEAIFTEEESYASVDISRLHLAEDSIVTDGACGTDSHAVVGGLTGDHCDPSSGPGQHTYCVSQTSASGRNFVLSLVDRGVIERICAPSGGSCKNGTW